MVGLALLWAAAPAAAQPKELPAKVVTLGGQAETFRKGSTKWDPAKLRAELGQGDGVRTLSGGRVVLATTSGQVLRMAQFTQVFFKESEAAPDAAPGPTRVRLDFGWLWVAVVPGGASVYRIEADAGPVTVTIRGGGAGIRINPDGGVLVRVYHGAAVCVGPGAQRQWERQLADDQEMVVSAAGVPGDARRLTRDKGDAAWVRWNEELDHAGAFGGKPPKK
jgi:hypothetical protein